MIAQSSSTILCQKGQMTYWNKNISQTGLIARSPHEEKPSQNRK